MEEKEKKKREVEKRVKLGWVEETIKGRMIDSFQFKFNTIVLSDFYSTSNMVKTDQSNKFWGTKAEASFHDVTHKLKDR